MPPEPNISPVKLVYGRGHKVQKELLVCAFCGNHFQRSGSNIKTKNPCCSKSCATKLYHATHINWRYLNPDHPKYEEH